MTSQVGPLGGWRSRGGLPEWVWRWGSWPSSPPEHLGNSPSLSLQFSGFAWLTVPKQRSPGDTGLLWSRTPAALGEMRHVVTLARHSVSAWWLWVTAEAWHPLAVLHPCAQGLWCSEHGFSTGWPGRGRPGSCQLSVLLSARTELPLRRCHANTTVEHTPSHYGDPTGHKVTVGKLSPWQWTLKVI